MAVTTFDSPTTSQRLQFECVAVLVLGTGFGGDVSGVNGPVELGKLGLNAGTDHETGDYPQVVPWDFGSAAAARISFTKLVQARLRELDTRQIAALSGVDPFAPNAAELAKLDHAVRQAFKVAGEEVFRAMARALADLCFLLYEFVSVRRVFLGGGVAQGGTRQFLIAELIERGQKIGLAIAADGDSFALSAADPLRAFRDALLLKTQSVTTAPDFLAVGMRFAFEYFGVCEREGVKTLRRYLPYFAVDGILLKCEDRFPADIVEVQIRAGAEKRLIRVPNCEGVAPADLRIIACSAHCQLLSMAMLKGYKGRSNFEGEQIKATLIKSGIPKSVVDTFVDVYNVQGFSVLVERYRSVVVRRQASDPPVRFRGPRAFRKQLQKRHNDARIVVGIDIGASAFKASIWQVAEGRLTVHTMPDDGEPPKTPTVLLSDKPPFDTISGRVNEFFRQIVDYVAQKLPDAHKANAVAVTWPGPVTADSPSESSGVFQKIGLSAKIVDTSDEVLDEIDIKAALLKAWNDRFGTDVGFTLINDGTAFAAFYRCQDLVNAPGLAVRYHGTAGAAVMAVIRKTQRERLTQPR